MSKIKILSSFWLKIAALFFMTLDHVALMLISMDSTNQIFVQLNDVFRVLGRMAMPLFVFMCVEGVLHTHSFRKYIHRLGVIMALIMVFYIVVCYAPLPIDSSSLNLIKGYGNIFMDLVIVALTIFLLRQMKNSLKLLALLPIAYSLLSFFVKTYQYENGVNILWFPEFLYMQFDWYSLAIGLGFYGAYCLGNQYISYYSKKSLIDKEYYDDNGTTRTVINLLAVLVLLIANVLYYSVFLCRPSMVFWQASVQLFSVLAGIFILLYNGKRGFNAKWFQIGAYWYYPAHFIILTIIFLICS